MHTTYDVHGGHMRTEDHSARMMLCLRRVVRTDARQAHLKGAGYMGFSAGHRRGAAW